MTSAQAQRLADDSTAGTLPDKATLSVEETAKILGMGRNQAYEAIHKGEIPSIKVGARYLVPVPALRRMLAEGNRK